MFFSKNCRKDPAVLFEELVIKGTTRYRFDGFRRGEFWRDRENCRQRHFTQNNINDWGNFFFFFSRVRNKVFLTPILILSEDRALFLTQTMELQDKKNRTSIWQDCFPRMKQGLDECGIDTTIHRVHSYSSDSFHKAKIYNDESLHHNTWGKHDESPINQHDPRDVVIKVRFAPKSSRKRNHIR